MRYLAAAGIFLLAIVLGFGVGSYRAAALAEFVAESVACEVVKIAVADGYATNRGQLIDAIATSPVADAGVKAAMITVRRSKQC